MSDPMTPGDNVLRGVDPENLLVVDVTAIGPLLDHAYGALAARGMELQARADAWIAEHSTNGRVVIRSDQDFSAASDLFQQFRDHAGKAGEVEAARLKVKEKPFRAAQAIDAWFVNLRSDLIAAMTVMDRAQQQFAVDKADRERRARDALALKLQQEAQAAFEAARKANTEAAVDQAMEAEQRADRAMVEADAPVNELVRTRSALGVTTSLATKWDWKLVDIRVLADAVARGEVASDFLTVNASVVGAAIRGKNGRREIPGLEIFES